MHFSYKNLLVIIGCLSYFTSYTQFIIEGQIVCNEEAVAFASVYIDNTTIGTITEADGSFKIESSEAIFNLVISSIGYQERILSIDFNSESKKYKRLNIELIKDIQSLDAIVIIDKQTGLTKKTPYSVTDLDMKTISRQFNTGGLAASLTDLPGISGATLGTGIVKPFIRGLGFSRVVTIFQNNKLENHQWGQDHGLGLNNLGVYKVDVIKGPASILYGSGAVGGVLLIKDDESYLDHSNLTGTIGSSFNSVSNGIKTFASLGKRFNNHLFFAVDAAIENHADYKDGNGTIIGNSRINNQNFRIHTGLDKTNFKNKLSFTYLNQNLGIISDEELEASLATNRNDRNMQLPFQEVKDYLISYTQESFHEKFQTYFHISHHFNDRSEIEESFDSVDLGINQNHSFISGRISLTPKQNFKHTFGFQSSFIKTLNKNSSQEILIPDANTFDIGAYYLGSKQFDKLYLQAGIRFDYRKVTALADRPLLVNYGFVLAGSPENRQLSSDFGGLTGSFGATYDISKFQNIKVNLSSGFRAPDLAELFSNGPHPGTNRFEVGNANFEREQSFQTDISYALKLARFTLGASAYFNTISNYIFFINTGETRPEDGLQIWEFQQENAQLYGTELSIHYKFNEDISINSTAALVRGTLSKSDENLTFIPADNYSLGLNYRPKFIKSTQIETTLTHFSKQNRPGFNEIETPAYTLLNLGITKDFSWGNKNLTASISGNNLLNTTYVNHLSILRAFEIPNPGRSILTMLRFGF